MRKNLFYSLFTITFMLILCELALQFASFYIYSPVSKLNKVTAKDKDSFRILALGESTTTPHFVNGKETSWPYQLEKKLLDNNLDVRVFNEGYSGTTSAHILKNLDGYLDYYKPHLVIAMMGINDLNNLHYKDISHPFMNLKLLKVFRWLMYRLEHKEVKYMNAKDYEIFHTNKKLFLESFETGKKYFLDNIHLVDAKERYIHDLMWAIHPSNPISPTKKEIDRTGFVIKYGIENYSDSPVILNAFFGYSYLSNSKKECATLGLSYLSKGKTLTDEGYTRLAYCLETDRQKEEFESYLPNIEFPKVLDRYFNHKILAKKLSSRGIKLIFMQYPTLNTQELIDGLKGSEVYGFVSNEENFRQAIDQHGFEYVFRDRFKGSWGHTNEKGSFLVANSVLSMVKTIIEEKILK